MILRERDILLILTFSFCFYIIMVLEDICYHTSRNKYVILRVHGQNEVDKNMKRVVDSVSTNGRD